MQHTHRVGGTFASAEITMLHSSVVISGV